MRTLLTWMAACWLALNVASAGETVQLMANTSPPYADARLPEQGLAVELVTHVFSRTGYTPEIAILPWSQALEGAELGVYQGLASAWYSSERDKDLLFSEPYLVSDLIIVKLRSRQGRPGSMQGLAGARLGVQTDYAYGIDFDAVPGLQLVQENHLVQNLLNLLNGKVDVVLGDRRTVVMQLNEYLADQRSKFEVLPIELPQRKRHVAISRAVPDHAKIIAAFNQALKAARADGSHGAVLARWSERYQGIE